MSGKKFSKYLILVHFVKNRDNLIERFQTTQEFFFEKDCKRVAYLSMEFLLGRSLQNSIHNLKLENNYAVTNYFFF